MSKDAEEFTMLLERWQDGDGEVVDPLMNAAYAQLKRVARGLLRHERADHTLQATALVHEAYLRLFQRAPLNLESREAFFRLLARKMRRLLIDHARRRKADKRGGDVPMVTFDEGVDLAVGLSQGADEALFANLDLALEQFEREHPRAAQVVRLRYFAGLTIEEVAASVHVGTGTVKSDLRFAKGWLRRALAVG